MALSRREFLLSSASSSAVALGTRNWNVSIAYSPSSSRGRLLLGLSGVVYFNGFNPFLNWWKTASAPTISRSSGNELSGQQIWDAGGYLDPSSGEIMNPAPPDLLSISRAFYKSTNSFQVAAGCSYAGEEWTVTWDGSADGLIDFATGAGAQEIVGRNRIEFKTGEDPDKVALVLTLTNRNDPPRNVRIFQNRYLQNVVNGERFNPDWLGEVKQFGVLRFMDWTVTNNLKISEFSQLADESYFAWGQEFYSWGQQSAWSDKNGQFGPKGSMHPRLICELANQTGCNIHVCIPVHATDDFVTRFAAYFKENTDVEVTYEFSNECWNSGFEQFHYCRSQGSKIWPGDFWGFAKWYGYRAAECMRIIRDVYSDASRWRGALATQTVDVAKTVNALTGVNYWRGHTLAPANSLQVSDLFKSLFVTGYFGFVVSGQGISHITNATPGVCTAKHHGFKNGQKIKLFVTDGPRQLNAEFAKVGNSTEDTFELSGISTVAMGAYLPPCRLATSGPLPHSPIYDNGSDGAGATLTAATASRMIIEGSPLSAGDIVLVKDQTEQEENGVYQVSAAGDEYEPWLLVRTSYFDRPAKMAAGSSVRISQGVNANNVFALDHAVEAVGRDRVTFSKIDQSTYAVDATLFEMMDTSQAKHVADPVGFPTKNTWFNKQVARALQYGSCDTSLTVSDSVTAMEKFYWPEQLAIAQKHGLTLRQYEGGCGVAGGGVGMLGKPDAIVYGGNSQFGEYLFNFGHSREVSAVYADNYARFKRIGGEYPAKFTADGRSSNAGPWSGVRFWPLKANANIGDIGNPVWAVTLAANSPQQVR
jgi:hypothetical protein